MSGASCTVDHMGGPCPLDKPHPRYRVEVKSDEHGDVEEILLHDSDRLLMHLERENRDVWWLGIYPDDDPLDFEDACFDIFRNKKRVEVEAR